MVSKICKFGERNDEIWEFSGKIKWGNRKAERKKTTSDLTRGLKQFELIDTRCKWQMNMPLERDSRNFWILNKQTCIPKLQAELVKLVNFQRLQKLLKRNLYNFSGQTWKLWPSQRGKHTGNVSFLVNISGLRSWPPWAKVCLLPTRRVSTILFWWKLWDWAQDQHN